MVAMQEIQELASRIAAEFRPRRIILFGSHAYGRPSADADVDLLVVMPDGGNPLRTASEIARRIPAPFALDLLVCDPGVLQWRIDQQDWFLREITSQGKVLYAAADG